MNRRPLEVEARGWWWLSFCDPALPVGEQFLGVAIVWADNIRDAVIVSHRLGVNPGGEIAFHKLLMPPPARYRSRLLPKAEAQIASVLCFGR